MKVAPLTLLLIALTFPTGVSAEEVSGPQQGSESWNVEIQVRKLADKLAALFNQLPGEARYQRLAVARFNDRGERARDQELGALIAAMLTTYFRRDHGFNLVERERLKDVVEELALAQTGLVEEEAAQEVGKILQVQALVVGEVAEVGASFVINARVVAVETASTLAAEEVRIPIADLVAFSADAVVLRTRTGALFRSVIPGWGQYYNRQPIKAAAFSATEVLLISGALAFHVMGTNREDDYNARRTCEQLLKVKDCSVEPDASARAQEAAEDLRREGERDFRIRNSLLYVAAGLWALNILDAYLSGTDYQRETAIAAYTRNDTRGIEAGFVLNVSY